MEQFAFDYSPSPTSEVDPLALLPSIAVLPMIELGVYFSRISKHILNYVVHTWARNSHAEERGVYEAPDEYTQYGRPPYGPKYIT